MSWCWRAGESCQQGTQHSSTQSFEAPVSQVQASQAQRYIDVFSVLGEPRGVEALCPCGISQPSSVPQLTSTSTKIPVPTVTPGRPQGPARPVQRPPPPSEPGHGGIGLGGSGIRRSPQPSAFPSALRMPLSPSDPPSSPPALLRRSLPSPGPPRLPSGSLTWAAAPAPAALAAPTAPRSV